MSGASEFFIQPSELHFGAIGGPALPAGQWFRGIPTPGASLLGIPVVGGVPTCRNLAAASPPTLLNEYDIYSYTIGWAIYVHNNVAGAVWPVSPNVSAELALLVNDRVQYLASISEEAIQLGGHDALATDAWVSDLNNPVSLGARDRLSLRMGVRVDQNVDNIQAYIGLQTNGSVPIPFESTVSYRVLDLAGSRRL